MRREEVEAREGEAKRRRRARWGELTEAEHAPRQRGGGTQEAGQDAGIGLRTAQRTRQNPTQETALSVQIVTGMQFLVFDFAA